MEPSAKIIADSISPHGRRLTTMEVVMHRFVLAEFNTHRAFSRNSASSRAIPLKTQLERIEAHTATPLVWPAEQPGMQGGDNLPWDKEIKGRHLWFEAAIAARQLAEEMGRLGVHKSICNRILEPFMWHTVVVTATDWENYFKQRCSPLAQPEIRAASEAMQSALAASTPVPMGYGDWHTPYVDEDSAQEAYLLGLDTRHISAARCAKVSYMRQEVRDLRKEDQLYRRLVTADPPHMSPLEHVATPTEEFMDSGGNFRGWTQLRTQVWGRTL